MNVALALEVKKRVLAEPKRVFMGSWFEKVTKAMQKDEGGDEYKYLSCTTIGCIAGHTLFAALTPAMITEVLKDDSGTIIQDTAQGLLGLTKLNAEKLFFFMDASTSSYENNIDYAAERTELAKFKPGTRDYARVVAKAIDKCIELNG